MQLDRFPGAPTGVGLSLSLAVTLGLTGCPSDDTSDPTVAGDDSTSTTDDTDNSVTLTAPDTTTSPADTSTTNEPTDTSTTDPTDTSTTDSTDTSTTDPTDTSTTDSTTSGGAACGDSVADGDEVCDGEDLAGEACVSQGFDGGALGCLDDCSGYDTEACAEVKGACVDQIVVDIGSPVSMGALAMEDDDLVGSCSLGGGNDRVVAFIAPSDGTFVFDTFGSDFDTTLALFGDCDAASEFACNDDFGGFQSQLRLEMTAGQVTLIVVDGFQAVVGNFVLNIAPGPDCGNGLVEETEACDTDAGGLDCSALGLGNNQLPCLDDCNGLDASTCDAPTGYANCGLAPAADVCAAEEFCVSDGEGAYICLDLACDDIGDCPAAPDSGNPTMTCLDFTGDGVGDCSLNCDQGETCPDGMECRLGIVCMWP